MRMSTGASKTPWKMIPVATASNRRLVKNINDIINVRNNDGRIALHMAVIENIQSNLVELLMIVPSIDLSIQDADGMTSLDLLKQRPRSASSEIIIKRLISTRTKIIDSSFSS
ncbi:hypothetical protein U1Q18_011188 [Sarracenia purpurea var. burkii]